MENASDPSQQRSPFNHAAFLCTLCCYQRKAHDEPDAPVQHLYSSKRMLQIIMEHAFVEPARKIDLIEAAKNGQMSELRAKLYLTNVDINSEDSYGRTGVLGYIHREERGSPTVAATRRGSTQG